MYFGHGDMNGFNFWAEEVFAKYYGNEYHSAFGRMVFRRIEKIRGGPASGTIRATFDLVGPDDRPFAEEVQQYTFSGEETHGLSIVGISSAANEGPFKIGDTKEGTFAIRLAPELDAPRKHGEFGGGEGEAQIWGRRANWVDVDGVIDGQALGVAIFDSPKSFRHPTYWHARGYGLLAANPFGCEISPRSSPGRQLYDSRRRSVQFRYRVLIHNGNYKDAHVAEKYAEYAASE